MKLSEILLRMAHAETNAVAAAAAANMLDLFENGEFEDGSASYAHEWGSVEQFMIAGNGPSEWVVFVQIGDNLSAYLEYADSSGRAIVALPDMKLAELREQLRADDHVRRVIEGGDERTIVTEDGTRVREGDRVFNYYDGFWGTLGPVDTEGWADVTADDGRRAFLNGQRISTYDPRGSVDPRKGT